MKVNYTKNFIKNYQKRIKNYKKLDNKFKERLKLFLQNPTHPLLKDHQLKGTKGNYRAFSVSGDIRVIYEIYKKEIYLVDIGTHNQVY